MNKLTHKEAVNNYLTTKSDKDFTAFYMTSKPLYKNILRFQYNIHYNESEDIIDIFFLRIYTHINNYNHKYAFNTWAHTILKNEVLGYFKTLKKSRIFKDDIILTDLIYNEDDYTIDELLTIVYDNLEYLDEPHKTLLVDKYIKDMSLLEMASKYKVTSQIVKNGLRRARWALINKINDIPFHRVNKVDVLSNAIKDLNI